MKIVAGLLLDKQIARQTDLDNIMKDIETYIYHINKLIIFNISGKDQTTLYDLLGSFNKTYRDIEYIDCQDFGQVYNYQLILSKALEQKANYGIILERDVYYENDSLLMIKNLIVNETLNASVITPLPLYTCLEHKKVDYLYRNIKGSRLIGALINLNHYEEEGFFQDYYQTTFDYDYCISKRLKGYNIVLVENAILRDRKYEVIEKRFLFAKRTAFDRDLEDVYYETRNRHYLWDKYKGLDDEYIKIDKRLFKKEKKEMRLIDKNYRDKRLIILRAFRDYRNGVMGKVEL